MKISLISICTNRKKKASGSALCASQLPRGDMQLTLATWHGLLSEEKNKTPAQELYCGRGFSEIRKTVNKNDLGLWIISAGLGLIEGNFQIPSYNLTITPGAEESIQSKISPGQLFHPAKWWIALNERVHGTTTPILDLVNSKVDTFFIISVSSRYLDLISEDLFRLNDQIKKRIRITGIKSSEHLPVSFKNLWMPYDERFDGPQSPNPGTRSDFPQRVTRHFIEEVLLKAPCATAVEHAEIVSNILSSMSPPQKIKRITMSDEGIKRIILTHWADANGNGSRMLRILRDKENVACEQRRFADLFRQIKLRMS